MKEALDKIAMALAEQWLYDIEVFSQWWMYACLLIPASLYLCFFIIKWIFLTLPIWLPTVLVIAVLKGATTSETKKKKEN